MKFKNRVIIDIVMEDIHRSDAPDYCDAYIASAVWEDTLEKLSNEELDEANDDYRLVSDCLTEYLY